MEKFSLSDEERVEIEKQRTINDADLLKGGAQYVFDQQGEKRLDVTDTQLESAHKQMEEELNAREPAPIEKQSIEKFSISLEQKEREEKLLEEIKKEAVYTVNTIVFTGRLTEDRPRLQPGFRVVYEKGSSMGISLATEIINASNKLFGRGRSSLGKWLERKKITSAITTGPLTMKVPKYEMREITKKESFFSRTKKEMQQVEVGLVDQEQPFLKFTKNKNSPYASEPAYSIISMVRGNDENRYMDPGSGRDGGIFDGALILPKSLAQKTFKAMQENPNLILEAFRKLDPILVTEEEKTMPKQNAIFIIPEGEADKAYTYDDRGNPTDIKSEYVKEFPKQ